MTHRPSPSGSVVASFQKLANPTTLITDRQLDAIRQRREKRQEDEDDRGLRRKIADEKKKQRSEPGTISIIGGLVSGNRTREPTPVPPIRVEQTSVLPTQEEPIPMPIQDEEAQDEPIPVPRSPEPKAPAPEPEAPEPPAPEPPAPEPPAPEPPAPERPSSRNTPRPEPKDLGSYAMVPVASADRPEDPLPGGRKRKRNRERRNYNISERRRTSKSNMQ